MDNDQPYSHSHTLFIPQTGFSSVDYDELRIVVQQIHTVFSKRSV